MSGLRSMRRKLQIDKVRLAEQVQYERIQLARQVVKERCEKDVEFAKDVLKAVGEALPQEIKEACEKTIASGPKAEETTRTVEEVKDRIVEKVNESAKQFKLPQDLKEKILDIRSTPPEPGAVVLPTIGA